MGQLSDLGGYDHLCSAVDSLRRLAQDDSMKKIILSLFVFSFVQAGSVDFLSPKDGEKVKSPVKIKMLVKKMKVRPAGEDPEDKKSGHHHILLDMEPIPAGQPIPTDEKHLHFGKGQTETEIALPPGEHTLTLQFADGAHRSYGPKLSKTIKITVE